MPWRTVDLRSICLAALLVFSVEAQSGLVNSVPVPGVWTGYGTTSTGGRVAYDATRDAFLAVWTETASWVYPGQITVGQFLSASGTLQGGPFCIECDPNLCCSPSEVVPVHGRAAFVVAAPFHVVAVDAASGAVSPALPLPFNAPFALGGDPSPSHDAALLITRNAVELRAHEIVVDAGAAGVRVGRSVLLARDPGAGAVTVTPSNGGAGRHLVVWEKAGDLFGAILDRRLRVLDQGVVLRSPDQLGNPAVAGDGRQWLVAYEAVAGTRRVVRCVGVYWDSNRGEGYVGSEVPLTASTAVTPSVSCLGESFLVGVEAAGATLFTVDPFTCRPCESPVAVGHRGPLALGSQRGGGNPTGSTAMAFRAFTGQSWAHVYAAADGQSTRLGGDCGRGGYAAASCARAGNTEFRLRLRDARPTAAAVLVLGTASLGLACGPCTLVPDPASGAVLAVGLTDGHGNAEVPAPLPALPNLVGTVFLQQWLTAGGAGCAGAVDLSDAVRTRIE